MDAHDGHDGAHIAQMGDGRRGLGHKTDIHDTRVVEKRVLVTRLLHAGVHATLVADVPAIQI